MHGNYIEISHANRRASTNALHAARDDQGREATDHRKAQGLRAVLSARERYAVANARLRADPRRPQRQPARAERRRTVRSPNSTLATLAERADALNWVAPELEAGAGIRVMRGRDLQQVARSVRPNRPCARRRTPHARDDRSHRSIERADRAARAHRQLRAGRLSDTSDRHDRPHLATRIGAGDDARGSRRSWSRCPKRRTFRTTNRHGALMDEVGRSVLRPTTALRWPRAVQPRTARTRCSRRTTSSCRTLRAVSRHRQRASRRECGDSSIPLHAVKEGPANRSFGLQVAALAGLPKPVMRAAQHCVRHANARKLLSGIGSIISNTLAPKASIKRFTKCGEILLRPKM